MIDSDRAYLTRRHTRLHRPWVTVGCLAVIGGAIALVLSLTVHTAAWDSVPRSTRWLLAGCALLPMTRGLIQLAAARRMTTAWASTRIPVAMRICPTGLWCSTAAGAVVHP